MHESNLHYLFSWDTQGFFCESIRANRDDLRCESLGHLSCCNTRRNLMVLYDFKSLEILEN